MTIAIYVRVSTEEQAREGYSISAQKEKLKAFCLSQDWTDFKLYPDEGVSAKDLNRPEMQKLLKHIKEGKINTVLVYRLDRMTRSVRDLHELLDYFDQYNCKFKSATEVFDTTTAMGRLFVTIVGALSSWERENLGERVQFGQIEKARQGEFSAPAPYGFNKKNNKLQLNRTQAPILREIVDKAISGESSRQIANSLNARGVPTIRGYQWHIGTVISLLRNPVLYGAMRWKDEVIENTHEGIMSKEEFLKLRKIIEARRNFKKRDVKSIFIFQGKLHCSICGGTLTCERNKYHRKRDDHLVESNGYRCQTCTLNGFKSPRTSEKKMLKALRDYMEGFEIRPTVVQDPDAENEQEEIKKKLVTIERQRAKYQQAWSIDLMTDEEFSIRMKETKKEVEFLEKLIKEFEPVQEEIDPIQVMKLVDDFNKNWDKLQTVDKRSFIQRFVERIEFSKDAGVVRVECVYFY